jgi:hypothetical protein
LVLLLACSACPSASFERGVYENDQVRYHVAAIDDGWRQVALEQGNVAYFNQGLEASLLVNSHCKVKDASLEGLTQELFFGMTERAVLSEALMPASGREGLETVATAKLDGVERKLATFVVKKDGCVYDVVLDAPPASFDAALPSFRSVRDGLRIEPRKDREAAQ